MTKSDIITRFHLQYDDMSELSTQEESDLFDQIYTKVCTDRPWEFTRKVATGTQSTTVPYIALPADFAYLLQNANGEQVDTEANYPVIYVGTQYTPYKVVTFADRRRYLNKDGYAYIDIVNSRLYFTLQPTSANVVEYDYCATPVAITNNNSPAFPARFHDIIYYGMTVDANIIAMSDKAKSYAPENQQKYDDYLASMAYWNANLLQL